MQKPERPLIARDTRNTRQPSMLLVVLALACCVFVIVSINVSGVHLSQVAGWQRQGEASPFRYQRQEDVTQTMLETSSMWGVGADARQQLVRHANVPLVTWDENARRRLEDEYRRLQLHASCARSLVIHPYSWGITSQIRDYGDALLVALATNRTLVYVQDGPRPKWCSEDAWLECFFDPLVSTACRLNTLQLLNLPQIAATNRSTALSTLLGPTPVVYFDRHTRFSFILQDPRFFPNRLWDEMLTSQSVSFYDNDGEIMQATVLRRNHPDLYHIISLSALRTMVAPIAFAPKHRLVQSAQARVDESVGRSSRCIAVHLRWTDKKKDRGIAARMNFTVDHVPAALKRIKQRTGTNYKCVILLSDDPRSALAALERRLGSGYSVHAISRIDQHFVSSAQHDNYKKRGHEYVHTFLTQDPDFVYAYFREVIVDVLAALCRAEYLIGVGSSGVSQLLSQYMGAVRHVDSNAMAVWQEDVARNSPFLHRPD